MDHSDVRPILALCMMCPAKKWSDVELPRTAQEQAGLGLSVGEADEEKKQARPRLRCVSVVS